MALQSQLIDAIRVRENSSLGSALKESRQNSGIKEQRSQKKVGDEYTTIGANKRSRDRIQNKRSVPDPPSKKLNVEEINLQLERARQF